MLLDCEQIDIGDFDWEGRDWGEQQAGDEFEPRVDIEREHEEGKAGGEDGAVDVEYRGEHCSVQIYCGGLEVIAQDQIHCNWAIGECGGVAVFQDKIQTRCVFVFE